MAKETEALPALLEKAHADWLSNPPAAQSPKRTLLYQEAFRDFFVQVGFNPANIHLDYPVSALFDKTYDLVYAPYNIPRLAISFKITPIHEMSAHARTRLEEAAGDATNVHMQFPDMVLGFFWVWPVKPDQRIAEGDWKNLRQALVFLSRLTGRPSSDSPPARYEGIGAYPCGWRNGEESADQERVIRHVDSQVPDLLSPKAMAGLLLANYRLRFGELHEG